jgi:hypothetical protein
LLPPASSGHEPYDSSHGTGSSALGDAMVADRRGIPAAFAALVVGALVVVALVPSRLRQQ